MLSETLRETRQEVARAAGVALQNVRIRGIARIMRIVSPPFLGPGVQVRRTVSGIRLSFDAGDPYSCMMFFGRYSPELLSVIRAFATPGSSVLDIGAQLGYITANVAAMVGREGHVYSFEPDPWAVANLEKTVQSNKFDWVRVFAAAASERTGTVVLNVSPVVGWSTVVTGSHHHDLKPVTVPSLRIDDLAQAGEFVRPIRFIKMDVEGLECSVLDGMTKLLAEDDAIILAEVNSVMLKPNGHTTPDLLRRLACNGRRLFRVSERRGIFNGGRVTLTPMRSDADLPFCDVLAVPQSVAIPPELEIAPPSSR
jgi:FkbM family methyltransferase